MINYEAAGYEHARICASGEDDLQQRMIEARSIVDAALGDESLYRIDEEMADKYVGFDFDYAEHVGVLVKVWPLEVSDDS